MPTTNKKSSVTVIIFYIMFIMAVSMILSAIAVYCANDMFAFVKPDITATVEIGSKTGAFSVGHILKKQGVVNSGLLFSLYAAYQKIEFLPGNYELNCNMDYDKIIKITRKPPKSRSTVWVTITEGMDIKKIKKLLVDLKVCKQKDLEEVLKNYDFSYEYLKALPKVENRLEGYLFPDTYEFYINDKPAFVIDKMLKNFDKKLNKSMRQRAKDRKMTIAEVVTVASMIEKEAKIATDRAKIASVIYNRLKNKANFPYLQIDATVIYGLENFKDELTAKDLKTNHPYNTYLIKGLPPGPICSPGFDALDAALFPENTKYYYYVAKKDGSHIFSKTIAEHNKAVESVKNE